MQQSASWEAICSSATQELVCIVRNPKVHYRIHNSPQPIPLPGQINPVHARPFISWRSNLVTHSHPYLGLPSDLFPSGFPTKSLYAPLPSPTRATVPANLTLLHLLNNIWCAVQIMKLLIMYSSPLPCYLVPLKSKYLPQHHILRTNLKLHTTQISHNKIIFTILSHKSP